MSSNRAGSSSKCKRITSIFFENMNFILLLNKTPRRGNIRSCVRRGLSFEYDTGILYIYANQKRVTFIPDCNFVTIPWRPTVVMRNDSPAVHVAATAAEGGEEEQEEQEQEQEQEQEHDACS